MSYCFDTSSFVNPWAKWYPYDTFPSIWQNLDRLIESESIIASEEVFRETEKQADDLHDWLKKRQQIFVPVNEDIQTATIEILTKFPNLVNYNKQRSQADPFVIATAIVYRKTPVTEETPSQSITKPRIPNVCQHFGLEYINFLELMKREKWRF